MPPIGFGFTEAYFKPSDRELVDDAIDCEHPSLRGIRPSEIETAVARGVVASEKGAWLATSRSGQTISALVSADDRADLANGACFNDSSVEVEPA